MIFSAILPFNERRNYVCISLASSFTGTGGLKVMYTKFDEKMVKFKAQPNVKFQGNKWKLLLRRASSSLNRPTRAAPRFQARNALTRLPSNHAPLRAGRVVDVRAHGKNKTTMYVRELGCLHLLRFFFFTQISVTFHNLPPDYTQFGAVSDTRSLVRPGSAVAKWCLPQKWNTLFLFFLGKHEIQYYFKLTYIFHIRSPVCS